MTVRLSPQQRQVLDELAHMRVAPEDAWMTTSRLAQLTQRTPDRTRSTLGILWERQLVDSGTTEDGEEWRWRITAAGREALG